MPHTPNRLKADLICLIWQNFVGSKLLTFRQKKCWKVRADEVLTPSENSERVGYRLLGGTNGRNGKSSGTSFAGKVPVPRLPAPALCSIRWAWTRLGHTCLGSNYLQFYESYPPIIWYFPWYLNIELFWARWSLGPLPSSLIDNIFRMCHLQMNYFLPMLTKSWHRLDETLKIDWCFVDYLMKYWCIIYFLSMTPFNNEHPISAQNKTKFG